jgi:NAD(P)-dependent dehydrogenase (short-subunit alcohol dehydrogenase family)
MGTNRNKNETREASSMNTWLITGCSRGFGLEIARAAMRSGHRVVATARRKSDVEAALGSDNERLLTQELDITQAAQAPPVVEAAVARFGTIDVLVNNAGYGHLGFFEETSDADVMAQFQTNLFGQFHVLRAVLPVMRRAGKGRIFNLSSLAGFRGNDFASLYCSSKFALEGFSEALAREVAPFGIHVTILEPGPFRTDFLAPQSLKIGVQPIADYDDRREKLRAGFENRNGRQPGDPVKLAEAVVRLASEAQPPLRFLGGSFACSTADAKLKDTRAEFDRWRELSRSLDY